MHVQPGEMYSVCVQFSDVVQTCRRADVQTGTLPRQVRSFEVLTTLARTLLTTTTTTLE